jgi:hypothetical protein
MHRIISVLSFLLLAACTQIAADAAYPQLAASARADIVGCQRGDREQCLKLQRAQDKCQALLARRDAVTPGEVAETIMLGGTISGASASLCRRLADDGLISITETR